MEKIGIKMHMLSAENPTGEKGKACLAKINPNNPNLYWSKNAIKDGYKVRPFIRIEPKSTVTKTSYKGMG